MNQNIEAKDFGRVAVLMGGRSAERAVSLRSGDAVLQALLRRGVKAQAVDPDVDVIAVLKQEGYDRVFIALHGRGGEDGQIQGALDIAAIPYTGSGVLGSAIGMDKHRTKLLWKGLGIPTPEFAVLRSEADLSLACAMGFPLAVKPVREGSSIGVTRVTDADDLATAWQAAAAYDNEVLAEPWILGEEYTCALLADEALPLIRLETPRTFYDYEAKYLADSTRYLCPCGLPATIEQELQAIALEAFRAIGATGWGRVDLIRDARGQCWCLEVNTVPGMTDHSLVPMAARQRGIDFDELVWRILCTSLERG